MLSLAVAPSVRFNTSKIVSGGAHERARFWKGALGEAFEESLAYPAGTALAPIPSHVDLLKCFERLWAVPCRNGRWIPGRWLLILVAAAD